LQVRRLAGRAAILHLCAHNLSEVDQLLGQLARPCSAGKQSVVEQAKHIRDIGNRALPLFLVGNPVHAQSQPGQKCPHIVRNATQHRDPSADQV